MQQQKVTGGGKKIDIPKPECYHREPEKDENGGCFMKKESFRQSMVTCAMLAITGGFLEAYTYLLKGGVFCNAQTGNVVMMGVKFAQGNYLGAAYYLIPMFFYTVGITLTVRGPVHIRAGRYHRALRRGHPEEGNRPPYRLTWEVVYVVVQMGVLTLLALLPDELPDACWNVPITFLCAMQYNTFNRFKGVTLATTFCTNNLRQTAIRLNKGMLTGKQHFYREAAVYAQAIVYFMLGGGIGAVLAMRWGGIALLFCALLLVPVLIGLIREDSRRATEGTI